MVTAVMFREIRVWSREELARGPLFDNLSMIEHQKAVGVLDSTQSVRDNKHRHGAVQCADWFSDSDHYLTQEGHQDQYKLLFILFLTFEDIGIELVIIILGASFLKSEMDNNLEVLFSNFFEEARFFEFFVFIFRQNPIVFCININRTFCWHNITDCKISK